MKSIGLDAVLGRIPPPPPFSCSVFMFMWLFITTISCIQFLQVCARVSERVRTTHHTTEKAEQERSLKKRECRENEQNAGCAALHPEAQHPADRAGRPADGVPAGGGPAAGRALATRRHVHQRIRARAVDPADRVRQLVQGQPGHQGGEISNK